MAYPNFFTPNSAQYWAQNPMNQAQSNLIWVQGENAAKAYPVQPGANVIMLDSEGECFYIKSTDLSGMPQLRKFSYKEITNEHVDLQPTTPDYITREEFEKFKSDMNNRPRYNKNYKKEDRVNE